MRKRHKSYSNETNGQSDLVTRAGWAVHFELHFEGGGGRRGSAMEPLEKRWWFSIGSPL